jgi:DNA repair protein RadA/Sms
MKPKSTSTPASALKFSLNAAKQSKFKLNSKNNYDDDDDEDDEDDYINDDELKKYSNNSIKFNPNPISFGPGKGRSAPTQRKAMGKSGASDATVHVCTNCGAEYVKWVGRCSTCKEWNTVQEFRVGRERRSSNSSTSSAGRPVFKSSRGGGSGSYNSNWNRGNDYNDDRPSSWLTGIESDFYDSNEPVRITDVYKSMGYDDESKSDKGRSNDIMSFRENRIKIPGDEEFNNVLGSGIMPGSLILLGGDPGVGKSTLLLQMAGQVASLSTPPRGIGMGMDDDNNNNNSKYGSMQRQGPVLYVSGEENSVQIASRAMRLGIDESELLLFCETDADFIAETVASYADDRGLINNGNDFDDQFEGGSGSGPEKKASTILGNRRQPSLLIIDSIQTMICDNGGSSSAGGITQVRECVGLFLRLAKSTGVSIILVGHVTKTGGVAGPRTVEHMVDTVLYLEGGASGGGPNLRMLRASKNRFGSSDEVGVYEMNGSPELGGRLVPVSDPSSLFLADRFDSEDLEGCAISIVLEGIRPMTVEVQALVTGAGGNKSFSGRRTVDGLSTPRLLLILAVLQKRCGISLSRHDVYINVVGGIRLSNSKQEGSGSDLAVAVSLASSLFNIPVRSDTAFVGEIGLLGKGENI